MTRLLLVYAGGRRTYAALLHLGRMLFPITCDIVDKSLKTRKQSMLNVISQTSACLSSILISLAAADWRVSGRFRSRQGAFAIIILSLVDSG